MIRTIKITCPYCSEVSELFLSMNPTVIVLNCPECWTPLMYDKNEIRILSDQEISKIATAPSSQEAINSFFDKISQKSVLPTATTTEDLINSLITEVSYDSLTNCPNHPEFVLPSREKISPDDIMDLHNQLEECEDVLQFIDKC